MLAKMRQEKDKTKRNELYDHLMRPVHFIRNDDSVSSLDCYTSINVMFDMICDISNYHSIDNYTCCLNCEIVTNKGNMKHIQTFSSSDGKGIEKINEILGKFEKRIKQHCTTCSQPLEIVKIPQRIVFVDAENTFRSDDRQLPQNAVLANITTEIVLNRKSYELKGVVEHIPSQGHFIAT